MAVHERSFLVRCFLLLTGPFPVFIIVASVTAALSDLPTWKEILQALRDFPIGAPSMALHLLLPLAIGLIAALSVFMGRSFYQGSTQNTGEASAGPDLTREERARAILRGIPVAVITLSPDARITYRNPAAKAMYSSETGKESDPIDDIIDQSGLGSRLRPVFEGECITIEETLVQIGESSEKHILSIKGVPVMKKDRVVEALFFLEDITESDILAKRLIGSEEKYRDIFSHAPLGIFLVDSKGGYLDANPAALKILGYTLDELLTLNTREISSDSGNRINKLLSSPGWIVERTRYLRKDGSVVEVELAAGSFQRGAETRFIGIIREIEPPEKDA